MTCETKSGPYQCSREKGHAGECECSAPEYAERLSVREIEERVTVNVGKNGAKQ